MNREQYTSLEQIPNVSPALAKDLRLIGVSHPRDLVGRNPYAMYEELCRKTRQRHDPCIIDAFISVVRFMQGDPERPWSGYTSERKRVLAGKNSAQWAPPDSAESRRVAPNYNDMKADNFGMYSSILGCLSFFCTMMLSWENSQPGIVVGSISISAICFGVMSFIKKGYNKGQAAVGIILGLICFIFSFVYVFFPEIELKGIKGGYDDVTFIGNSNIVGLRYCNSYDDCFIKYTYDVSTQKFIKQEKNNNLDKYSYSRDGKKVLFVDGSEFEKNIFIMNADGSEKRQLTFSSDKDTITVVDKFDFKSMNVWTNSCPSFSSDGKRVIFVRCKFIVKERSGVLDKSNYDVYEIDLNTGAERQLTSYNFREEFCPQYFSDGKRFIFGGNIFVMEENNNNELKPAIRDSSFNKNQSISFDDKILYLADDARHYSSELFIKIGDEIKQLTYMQSKISNSRISSDGKLIVFKEDRRSNSSHTDHFWIMNSDGTGLKELIPPKD